MFISNYVRSAIVSRLRPWLLEEPEVVTQLGLLASHGFAKNLVFNPSALNPLIEDSTRLEFRSVEIGEFCVRVRPWSSPSILVEVRGLRITLAPRGTTKQKYGYRNSATRKKKEIASLDPEGASLHDVIERLLSEDSPADRVLASWADVIASCCQIKFHDILLQLQVMTSYACLLEIDECCLQSEFSQAASFVRKFLSSFFVLGKGSGLSISFNAVKFYLKESHQKNSILSFYGLSVHANLLGYRLISSYLHVLATEMRLSPELIPLLLLMVDFFSSKEPGCLKAGRDLWKIAACRINHLILCSRSSLYNAVEMVVLWSRYVNMYTTLLTMVRSFAGTCLVENVLNHPVDKKSIMQAKYQLGIVLELEEKLTVEMVVKARRVARYRRFHCSTDVQPNMVYLSTLRKIFVPFWLLWKIVHFTFQTALHLFLCKVMNLRDGNDKGAKNGFSRSSCFYFEEIYVTCSYSSPLFPMTNEFEMEDKMNLPSFCLSIKQSCVIRETHQYKMSFFTALGGIKIFLAPLFQVALDSDLVHMRNLSSKNVHTGSQDGSKVILWSSPASLFPPNATTTDDSLNFFDNYFKKNIEDLWSYWMEVREKPMANNLHKDAFLLCRLQCFQTESYIKDGPYVHANFSLNVGKMSLDLDYSSIFDAVLLYQQLVDHFHCLTSSGSNISCTSGISVDRLGNNIEKVVDFYNKIVSSIVCIIPSKNIFVGALIAGPSIRVSLDRFSNGFDRKINPIIAPGNGYYWFKIDIGSIEFVMLPASKSVLTALFAEPRLDVQHGYIWLKEPHRIFAHQEQNTDNKFTAHECITLNAVLKACLVDVSSGFACTNQSHVVEPITITTKVSIHREYQHSFYAMDDFLSVVFSVLTSSATFLVYMDDLENLCKLAVSFSDITCNGPRSCWEFAKQLNDELCSVPTDVSVVSQNSFLLIDATFEHETLDVVLDESREKSPSSRTSKIFGSSGCNRSCLSFPVPKMEARSLDMLDLSCFGLGFSLRKCCTKVFTEAETVNVLIDLFGFQIVILDQQSLMRIASDIFQIKNFLSEFVQHRHQFHLSCCTSRFSFQHGISGSPIPLNVTPRLDSENFQIPSSMEASYCSNARSSSLVGTDHKFELVDLHTMDTKKSIPVYSFVVHIELGDIIVSEYHGSSLVDRSDRSCKLELLMFVREGLPWVNCKIQGGYIFLEAFTFSKFLQCFQVYYVFISSFMPRRISVSRDSFSSRVSGNNFSIQDLPSSMDHAINSIASTSSETLQATKFNFVDVFTIDLRQFSLTLALADGSGKAEELIIEVDVLLRLMDSGRKIIVDLYRLEIFTQHLHNDLVNETSELHMPHFCSTSTCSGSHSPSGENTPKDMLCVSSGSINAPMPGKIFKNQLNNDTSTSYSRHSILKCMVGSATLKKIELTDDQLPVEFNSFWVGNGSISGLNLFIKISEIQVFNHMNFVVVSNILYQLKDTTSRVNMFLNVYFLLTKAFALEDDSSLVPNFPQRNCERIVDSDYEIPDGAIVAIQDVQQHMYFAIELVGKKYQLVGALHYFLVGKRALFKVRYHSRWRTKRPCMSFISLYAESNKGEPLCINFIPGSCFVGISGRDGDVSSIWQTVPNERNDFENEDMKLYERAQNGFNLVNLKNDCAVAFIDGIPEFVKKPGNQFKIKLFSTFVLSKDIAVNVSELGDTFDKYPKGETSSPGRERTEQHINVKIDMVTLTICHEVSDVDDHLPLLRFCLDNIAILGQILLTKLRMLSSFSAVLHHFDSGMNIWREVLAPVEFSLFYRSRFAQPESLVGHHGVPVHFFLRISQVDVLLSEISLDMLLYLVGKLDLAGPYVVRQAVIFPNCCKLENHTSLTALFQFQENQNVVLSQGQSSAAYLRHIALDNQLPDNQNIIKISLLDNRGFSTSPISISLSDVCFFAWRTRLASLEDSRIFPGPFVVIEVAKKNEEGLSVVIAPLLRIHNESTFTMELCFRRPDESSKDSASVMLKHGDTVDDSKAVFEALDFDGGSKRTLMSLTLGNFLLSLRPQFPEYESNERHVSFCWSEEIKGEKAQRVSGMFDKLNYKFRKALGAGALKSFYSLLCCPITMEGQHASSMHFLIQTIGREVPLMQPQNLGDLKGFKTSPVAMQVQKEIFIYPTIQVHNLLQCEIFVSLVENDPETCSIEESANIGRQADIPSQSSSFFYANPDNLFFRVTLKEYGYTCKPVNSDAWVKKLDRKRNDAHYIDTELNFRGRAYFAFLRLSCSERGFLEATIFTIYTLHNNSELPLLCYDSSQKFHARLQPEGSTSDTELDLGCCLLPPKSIKSWFFRGKKLHIRCFGGKTAVALLDLDILTGFTELSLEAPNGSGTNKVARLGVSLEPCINKIYVPAQLVSFVPRFIIANESMEPIIIRPCYLQGDAAGEIIVEARQRVPLHIARGSSKKRENNPFDSLFRRNTKTTEETQIFVQFCKKEFVCASHTWSGPICVASLGRFFLKFRGNSLMPNSSNIACQENNSKEFAAAHIVEEKSSFVLYFYMPPDLPLPYRIENLLNGLSVKYYQKNSIETDILRSGDSSGFVWDNLSLPHKLIVELIDFHLVREINIDKVSEWKPFFKIRQQKGLLLHFPLNKQSEIEKSTSDEPHKLEIFKVGFEIYADGSTRVLRFCEATKKIEHTTVQPSTNFQLRLSSFAIHLLERKVEAISESLNYAAIVVASLGNVTLDSIITHSYKYNHLRVQSFTVDEKWQGAPFASMVRRSHLHDSGMNVNILHIIYILQSTKSKVKQVKYSSIILQPIDLKIDEETLMKLAPFWRSSNSSSSKQSQQFYFKHFEIHPIKITASFLPGNQYPGYSSAQQALRSFLHSVLKVPSINNVILELNGVLLTHALVTSRELLVKCAQHYSWYLIRSVYIAKGSSLLPPAFASIFDDTASSSLDVFFDPSDGSISLPGVTLGMFKIISKCINVKGFSGTKRYFGDLGKMMKAAGSNVLFAAATEISDNVLRGAESSGFKGLVTGFHQGILRLAMDPSLLGAAVMEGGADRKIKLDRSPGIDELYIEGYLQAMLDVMYKLEYLRVRVIDNQVILKNLPPSSSIINEILENVKSFLMSKALLKGDSSAPARPLRHLRSENDWKLGPTILTLVEHLFVSFTIRMLRKQTNKLIVGIRWTGEEEAKGEGQTSHGNQKKPGSKFWAVGKFFFSGMIAYVDGRLCRHIPHPLVRRIVSGFLLSFLDKNDGD